MYNIEHFCGILTKQPTRRRCISYNFHLYDISFHTSVLYGLQKKIFKFNGNQLTCVTTKPLVQVDHSEQMIMICHIY